MNQPITQSVLLIDMLKSSWPAWFTIWVISYKSLRDGPNLKVVKVVFLYRAVFSPLDRSKRFTLFALPGRPVHSDSNSASPGSILARQQLSATTKSLTFPTLSIARCSSIHLSHQGCQWRERKCPIFEMVAKGDSNPGSLDCESSLLPLSYRAPQT